MSNYLAIATATATLGQLVQEAIQKAVPGATISFEPPEKVSTSPNFIGSNIYLYRVAPNAAYRSRDLPTRSDSGNLLTRPQVALDLYYVISFFGASMDARQLAPLRMLGSTISTLNAFPILTREAIRNIIKPRSSYDFLSTSDLADQVEQVKINLMTLSLEELSKLWTVFYQTTHRLSIAYQLSVILIDADLSPEQALPAQRINLHSTPGSMPVIKNVLPSKLFYRKSATLEVLGEHLSKPDYITRVYLNGSEGRTEFLSTDKLKVELPDNVAAGPLKVQVFLEQNSGRSDSAIEGSSIISSNSVYSSVLPTLKSPAHLYSGTDPQNPMSQIRTVVVQAIPDLNITQQGRLWLNLQEATYSSQNASSAFPVLRFICPESFSADLNEGRITGELISFFKGNNIALSSTSQITVHTENKNWLLRDQQSQQLYSIRRQGDHLMVYFGFGIPMYDISNSSAFLVEADLELVSGKYYVRLDVGTDQVMESNVNYNENTPVLDIE